jgi:hypothetical protein
VFRLVVGVCALSTTMAVHAATPLSLPLTDLGLQPPDVALPLPPPPQIARPDVSQMRIVIKRQKGCDGLEIRRPMTERRQMTAHAGPWATTRAWSRLG